MKKRIVFLIATMFFTCTMAFGQTHSTVKLSDDVYDLLEDAEAEGLCTSLYTIKPYTQKYIVSKLNEIAETLVNNKTNTSETELKIVREYIDRFTRSNERSLRSLRLVTSNTNDNLPLRFGARYAVEGIVSGGIYNNSGKNAFGFEEWNTLGFFGDLGPYVSFDWDGGIEFTKMPLEKLNRSDYEYYIGNWWGLTGYESGSKKRTEGFDLNNPTAAGFTPIKDPNAKPDGKNYERFINTYRNNAVLPYSYFKHWDGSVYHLSNFDASGLEGWPTEISFGLTMQGGIEASFFNDRLYVGISRKNREWGAMDQGAGLALNANARPFLGMEANFKLLDWFSFGALVGFLEFPHQEYINGNAWYLPKTEMKFFNEDGYPVQIYDKDGTLNPPKVDGIIINILDESGNYVYKDGNLVGSVDPRNEHKQVIPWVYDSYFFQTMFAMNIMNFDFKYFHFDFGSTAIFPKRLELGYMFPIFEKVIYQNNIGDFDNLGLFASMEGRLPGLGSIWGSVFIDEINAKNIKTMFHDSRCMFAYQAGFKSIFPLLPFGNMSFRYTKIEPFCYTHIAVKTPHNPEFMSVAYMNNGAPLGYYLEPNSDEFFFRLDGKPISGLDVGFQYQLIRHGTTWGPGSVEGSSIYSEIAPHGRDDMHKYFLRDGVYEWTNIVALDASYDLRRHGLPMRFNVSAGYVYDWFTKSGSYNKPGTMSFIEKTDPLYDFYPTTSGAVLSMGFKFFTF